MKEFLVKVKELWNNPRSHALMVIGLYFLFFAILYLIIQLPNESKPSLTVEEQYASLSEYRYEMQIETQVSTYQLSGTKMQYEETIVIGEGTYFVENGRILDSSSQPITTFNWNLFSPYHLSSFWKGTLNSTTNYKDGREVETYEMDCNKWDEESAGTCQFQVTYFENQITEVKLTHLEENYTVTITYLDMNDK